MKNPDIDTSKACVIGWDGDMDGVIVYSEGGYFIRDGQYRTVDFQIAEGVKSLDWYNREGFLPCLVTDFFKEGCRVQILHFADKVTIREKDFVIVYSRVSIANRTEKEIFLQPGIIGDAFLLQGNPSGKIPPLGCVHYDYANPADRFGQSCALPGKEDIEAAGGFDLHYERMKAYWNARLAAIADIKRLPDSRLIEAYKAGFIYTHIVKDGYNLHVGENGYDTIYDHDAIGILVSLFAQGDFQDAKIFLKNIRFYAKYDDARWKYSWPWALYLLKTGDIEYVAKHFETIRHYARSIPEDICGEGGIVKETWDIDSRGYWMVDNWSVLTGLCAYGYIAGRLGERQEEAFAKNLYEQLLGNLNAEVKKTCEAFGIRYLPCSVKEDNGKNICRNPRNTNWASMFLFGRWGWEGYLFGRDQGGIMTELIDATYEEGFQRGRQAGLFPHSFGGGTYSDFIGSYNAGLAAAGLRGKRYRSQSIYSYQAMLSFGMSGPFAWWESAGEAREEKWAGLHPESGDGSCPHIWGQACASKALLESLICEKYNGDILIGRGIPDEWLYPGKEIEIGNYPISEKGRSGYHLKSLEKNTIKIEFLGDAPAGDWIIALPLLMENTAAVSVPFTLEEGGMRIDKKVREVFIRIISHNHRKNLAYKKGFVSEMIPSREGTFSNATNGTMEGYTQSDTDTCWNGYVDLGRPMYFNRVNIITHEAHYASRFTIDISVDEKNWKTVARESRHDGKPKSYLFGLQNGRFIRFHPLETSGCDKNNSHALRHIEIFCD